MPLKPFYDLEHEYRQISALISKAADLAANVASRNYRREIVIEARAIVNDLNKPEPNWCDAK